MGEELERITPASRVFLVCLGDSYGSVFLLASGERYMPQMSVRGV